MQADKSGFLNRYRKAVTFLLSCVAAFTLHYMFEVVGGGVPDSKLLNSLNRLGASFISINFSDLVALFAVWKLFDHVFSRENRIDWGTGILSLLFSVLLVACISFKKFNSSILIVGNHFQWVLSIFCICGFWMIIYLAVRTLYFIMEKEQSAEDAEKKSFLQKAFSADRISGYSDWLAALDSAELSRHKLSRRGIAVKTVSGRRGLGCRASADVIVYHGIPVFPWTLAGRCKFWILPLLFFSNLCGSVDICV